MSDFEVPEAIICSPFEEPTHCWRLEERASRRSGQDLFHRLNVVTLSLPPFSTPRREPSTSGWTCCRLRPYRWGPDFMAEGGRREEVPSDGDYGDYGIVNSKKTCSPSLTPT